MQVRAALAGSLVLAACASDPPAGANASAYRADKPLMTRLDIASADHLMSQLAELNAPGPMRALLEDGLTKRELQYRGLDAVTVEEWIDGLVAASLDAQRRPGDPTVHAHFVDATDRYVAARREATIGRYADLTNCLPWAR